MRGTLLNQPTRIPDLPGYGTETEPADDGDDEDLEDDEPDDDGEEA